MPARSAKRIDPQSPVPDFRALVLAVVRRIPKGKLASYGQVAAMAGFPQRPRQVGMVLSGLPEGTSLPWHRVVNAQGRLAMTLSRQGSDWMQRDLLLAEGIPVDLQGRLPLHQHRWRGETQPEQRP